MPTTPRAPRTPDQRSRENTARREKRATEREAKEKKEAEHREYEKLRKRDQRERAKKMTQANDGTLEGTPQRAPVQRIPPTPPATPLPVPPTGTPLTDQQLNLLGESHQREHETIMAYQNNRSQLERAREAEANLLLQRESNRASEEATSLDNLRGTRAREAGYRGVIRNRSTHSVTSVPQPMAQLTLQPQERPSTGAGTFENDAAPGFGNTSNPFAQGGNVYGESNSGSGNGRTASSGSVVRIRLVGRDVTDFSNNGKELTAAFFPGQPQSTGSTRGAQQNMAAGNDTSVPSGHKSPSPEKVNAADIMLCLRTQRPVAFNETPQKGKRDRSTDESTPGSCASFRLSKKHKSGN